MPALFLKAIALAIPYLQVWLMWNAASLGDRALWSAYDTISSRSYPTISQLFVAWHPSAKTMDVTTVTPTSTWSDRSIPTTLTELLDTVSSTEMFELDQFVHSASLATTSTACKVPSVDLPGKCTTAFGLKGNTASITVTNALQCEINRIDLETEQQHTVNTSEEAYHPSVSYLINLIRSLAEQYPWINAVFEAFPSASKDTFSSSTLVLFVIYILHVLFGSIPKISFPAVTSGSTTEIYFPNGPAPKLEATGKQEKDCNPDNLLLIVNLNEYTVGQLNQFSTQPNDMIRAESVKKSESENEDDKNAGDCQMVSKTPLKPSQQSPDSRDPWTPENITFLDQLQVSEPEKKDITGHITKVMPSATQATSQSISTNKSVQIKECESEGLSSPTDSKLTEIKSTPDELAELAFAQAEMPLLKESSDKKLSDASSIVAVSPVNQKPEIPVTKEEESEVVVPGNQIIISRVPATVFQQTAVVAQPKVVSEPAPVASQSKPTLAHPSSLPVSAPVPVVKFPQSTKTSTSEVSNKSSSIAPQVASPIISQPDTKPVLKNSEAIKAFAAKYSSGVNTKVATYADVVKAKDEIYDADYDAATKNRVPPQYPSLEFTQRVLPSGAQSKPVWTTYIGKPALVVPPRETSSNVNNGAPKTQKLISSDADKPDTHASPIKPETFSPKSAPASTVSVTESSQLRAMMGLGPNHATPTIVFENQGLVLVDSDPRREDVEMVDIQRGTYREGEKDRMTNLRRTTAKSSQWSLKVKSGGDRIMREYNNLPENKQRRRSVCLGESKSVLDALPMKFKRGTLPSTTQGLESRPDFPNKVILAMNNLAKFKSMASATTFATTAAAAGTKKGGKTKRLVAQQNHLKTIKASLHRNINEVCREDRARLIDPYFNERNHGDGLKIVDVHAIDYPLSKFDNSSSAVPIISVLGKFDPSRPMWSKREIRISAIHHILTTTDNTTSSAVAATGAASSMERFQITPLSGEESEAQASSLQAKYTLEVIRNKTSSLPLQKPGSFYLETLLKREVESKGEDQPSTTSAKELKSNSAASDEHNGGLMGSRWASAPLGPIQKKAAAVTASKSNLTFPRSPMLPQKTSGKPAAMAPKKK